MEKMQFFHLTRFAKDQTQLVGEWEQGKITSGKHLGFGSDLKWPANMSGKRLMAIAWNFFVDWQLGNLGVGLPSWVGWVLHGFTIDFQTVKHRVVGCSTFADFSHLCGDAQRGSPPKRCRWLFPNGTFYCGKFRRRWVGTPWFTVSSRSCIGCPKKNRPVKQSHP